MVPERFCHCFSGVIRVLRQAFRFEPIAMVEIVRVVPEGAQAARTGTDVITGMPSPRARSALPCSATGVRRVS